MKLDHLRYNQEFTVGVNGSVPNDAEGYGVRIEPAAVGAHQEYWRAIGVHHLLPEENQGNHNVYVEVLDAGGSRIADPSLRLRWGWEGQRADERAEPKAFDKPANEPATNLDVYRGQRIWLEIEGHGLPSDRVANLHTDHPDEPAAGGQIWNSTGHHSFYVVFQKGRKQSALPEDGGGGVAVFRPDGGEEPAGTANGHGAHPPKPAVAAPGRVLARQKIGIDANAPIDARTGDRAPQVRDPAICADTQAGWVRLNFILGEQWQTPGDQARPHGLTWEETYRQIVDPYRQRNMQIYGLISDEAVRPHPEGQFRQPPGGDPLQNAWIQTYVQNFVTIARMFRDDITVIESFNEPDDWKAHIPGWSEQHPNYVHPGWFAAMLEAIYTAMRAPQNADLHHIKLVSGPLQGLEGPHKGNGARDYLNRTYEEGIARFGWGRNGKPFPFDGVGYHLYIHEEYTDNLEAQRQNLQNTYRRYLNEMQDVVRAHENRTRPFYISEMGWFTNHDQRREGLQAESLRMALDYLLDEPSVALIVHFCIQDFGEDSDNKYYGLYRKGGLGQQDRKRAYGVFQELCQSPRQVPVPGVDEAVVGVPPKRTEEEALPALQPGQWLGTVTATVLNVRSSPETLADNGNKIGELVQGDGVVVLGSMGEWLFVRTGGLEGFVHSDYVAPRTAAHGARGMARDAQPRTAAGVRWTGTIDAPAGLRLRQAPGTDAEIVATLAHESEVQVIGEVGDWLHVETASGAGYLHGDYVLRPGQKARLSADLVRAVLRTWIRFKPLLSEQAAGLGIDPAVAVAVLLTESGGRGFDEATGRMIIRFENHQFYERWGRQHEDLFNRHFDFNRAGKTWTDHRWRPDENGEWLPCHPGDQEREWQVFEFARRLDEDAAIRSISMGAPQIMGFNFGTLAYSSPRAMFDAFGQSEAAQIDGLFRFIKGKGLDADLRRGDFLAFARGYNGPGQPEYYRDRIRRYLDAFQQEIAAPAAETERGAGAEEASGVRGLQPVTEEVPIEGVPVEEVAVGRLPQPLSPEQLGGNTLAQVDETLYKAWRSHIEQGFHNNQTMFEEVLRGFMNPYWTTVWMYRALFAVGILAFVAAIVLAYVTQSNPVVAVSSAVLFGGLGIVAFLSYFLSRPLQALEENLQLIMWLGVIYNSYWTRLAYITKLETVQEEIDATTDKTIATIKDLIATHKDLSGKRPGLR